MHDLAVITVSTNEGHWLRPCLSSVFDHCATLALDVVVADNESTDGTRELVETHFPRVRVVSCENRGFSHANNRALITCEARYVLFLNPDTEIVDGMFDALIEQLDRDELVGLVGVTQLTPEGAVFPTIRRFPNATRAFAEAVGSERLPVRARWLGERELDLRVYEREHDCDWVSGSFMLTRREALESAGFLDERFFIYSEETDLCYRIKQAGWSVRYVPSMKIIHHTGKRGANARMEAQEAFARLQFARKHFRPVRRTFYRAALCLRFGSRALAPGNRPGTRAEWRAAYARALRVALGIEGAPFGEPPASALRIRSAAQRVESPPTRIVSSRGH